MAAPTITNFAYKGEFSGASNSFTHTPAANQKGIIVPYVREEQYNDGSGHTYGGLSLTNRTAQSGGGSINAAYLRSLEDLTGKASNTVSWTDGYGNNHYWAGDLTHTGDVEFISAQKTTFSSWEAWQTFTVDPDEDSVIIGMLTCNYNANPASYIQKETTAAGSITTLYQGQPGGEMTGIYCVPVLASEGSVYLRLRNMWPTSNGSAHFALFSEVAAAEALKAQVAFAPM